MSFWLISNNNELTARQACECSTGVLFYIINLDSISLLVSIVLIFNFHVDDGMLIIL